MLNICGKKANISVCRITAYPQKQDAAGNPNFPTTPARPKIPGVVRALLAGCELLLEAGAG